MGCQKIKNKANKSNIIKIHKRQINNKKLNISVTFNFRGTVLVSMPIITRKRIGESDEGWSRGVQPCAIHQHIAS